MMVMTAVALKQNFFCDSCGSDGSGSDGSGIRKLQDKMIQTRCIQMHICLLSNDPEKGDAYWCKRCCDSGLVDLKSGGTIKSICDCLEWATRNGTPEEIKESCQKKKCY